MSASPVNRKVPRRENNSSTSLPDTLPVIGLGCSSFSTFFWTEGEAADGHRVTVDAITKSHPRVVEWIETIRFAVEECGINLLDTSPWYGHGTSEMVIGWALESMDCPRQDLIINTKVGRYEADPEKQFDFSRAATMSSVARSLERMKCKYIDVLQLHDPEFAPTLKQLMEETIPTMVECRSEGLCRALGMTGYPLEVQYQILQKTFEDYGDVKIWDQALTYSHFNLHDSSLVTRGVGEYPSFHGFCKRTRILLLAAAPLSMGLLTRSDPPGWHPASKDLKSACKAASLICDEHGVDITVLALLYAVSNTCIPTTIIGCKNVKEVELATSVGNRMHGIDPSLTHTIALKSILSGAEYEAFQRIMDTSNGPFARIWEQGNCQWDGVEIAREFWRNLGSTIGTAWQLVE